MRSKMMTLASTAIPTETTKAERPDSVKVTPTILKAAKINTVYKTRAATAISPSSR